MQLPVIHLNGSSRDALVRQNMNAVHALDEALALIGQAFPHMRDYYPLANGEIAYQTADKEARSRYLVVRSVRNELEALAYAISQIGKASPAMNPASVIFPEKTPDPVVTIGAQKRKQKEDEPIVILNKN
jgi:hypothetical protein